jgi:uncharacterized protein (DUF1015 family)
VERIYKGMSRGYNISGSALISPSGLEINGSKKLADIRAFRGTFYNPQVVEDLSKTIAPPYDIIDDKKKRALLSRSPYNIVRLILPQSEGGAEFWNHASTLYRAWKKGEVLTSDGGSCLYIYRQTFELPGEGSMSRTGILALLRCKDFSSVDILPHEKTFPRTRAERLSLLRACHANFSQIFTVFKDEDEEVLPLLEEATTDPPFIEMRDDEGVNHQVWRLEEGDKASGLALTMGDKKLIIADGHHRYETALAFSKEKHATASAAQAAAYVSVALFRSEDPGLAVLPVHRLLKRMPLAAEDVHGRLEEYFHVEVMENMPSQRLGMFRDKLESSRRPAFVMVSATGAALLTLRERVKPDSILEGPESDRWKNLDISILHSLVIAEGLGLDAAELAERGELYFTPWESAAMDALTEGEAQAAFLVRPTRMDEIWDIAEGGERMPHKSSYFYPKLASGLLIYDHGTALS